MNLKESLMNLSNINFYFPKVLNQSFKSNESSRDTQSKPPFLQVLLPIIWMAPKIVNFKPLLYTVSFFQLGETEEQLQKALFV